MTREQILKQMRNGLNRMNDDTQPDFDVFKFVDAVTELVETQERTSTTVKAAHYPEHLTVKHTASFLGCSTAKVYRLIKRGDLTATQECLGASFSISKQAIIDYLGYVPEAFKAVPIVKKDVVFVPHNKPVAKKNFSRRRSVKAAPKFNRK